MLIERSYTLPGGLTVERIQPAVGAVVSGVASYYLLNRPRQALADRVEVRAARASKAFEEMKAKEDQP